VMRFPFPIGIYKSIGNKFLSIDFVNKTTDNARVDFFVLGGKYGRERIS
jgi:hypothetical protein